MASGSRLNGSLYNLWPRQHPCALRDAHARHSHAQQRRRLGTVPAAPERRAGLTAAFHSGFRVSATRSRRPSCAPASAEGNGTFFPSPCPQMTFNAVTSLYARGSTGNVSPSRGAPLPLPGRVPRSRPAAGSGPGTAAAAAPSDKDGRAAPVPAVPATRPAGAPRSAAASRPSGGPGPSRPTPGSAPPRLPRPPPPAPSHALPARPPPHTLLQVLLVVPRLILADLELLHQAVGQHRALLSRTGRSAHLAPGGSGAERAGSRSSP